MKALYRKYRPLRLEDVVGQDQVTGPLINALESKKISHAYLFMGPRGTGKTSVARIFAHAVNGFEYNLEDDYVDIIEVDGASNRGVDNIREIREKAMIKPTLGKYKVYIIDEVHMLTKEAFNALLKTLEEPPEHVIFIMATTDAHKVPVTIVSRAQVYTFKLASGDVISRHLSQICEKEKIAIEPDAIQTITKRGGGSFRDSLSLLDQISTISSETITREMVERALGLPEEVLISELIKKYIARDTTGITTLLKDLFDAGVKAEIIAEEIIAEVIASPRPEVLPLLSKLPDVRAPFAEARLIYAITADLRDPSMITTTPSAVKPSIPTKPSALVAEPPKPAPVKSSPVNPFKERIMKSIKPQKDDVNSKISAIMGGEVQEYGGGSPF